LAAVAIKIHVDGQDAEDRQSAQDVDGRDPLPGRDRVKDAMRAGGLATCSLGSGVTSDLRAGVTFTRSG
jgi:hypothetical protein